MFFFFSVLEFQNAFSQKPYNINFIIQAKDSSTYELHIKMQLTADWHIYSQNATEGVGAFPTKIAFKKNPLVIVNGKAKEVGKLIVKHEEVLDTDLKYFEGKVDFVQTVKLKNNAKTTVNGTIQFMICNEERCLPPETVSFSVIVGGE